MINGDIFIKLTVRQTHLVKEFFGGPSTMCVAVIKLLSLGLIIRLI